MDTVGGVFLVLGSLLILLAAVLTWVLPGGSYQRVEVTVGATTWATSLFPDSARGTYLLPMKQAVRTAEGLADGSQVRVTVRVLV